MQKIFRALALMLVVTLALLPFVGCGGDDDDDDAGGVAAVTGTVPATGGKIAANGALIINFDNGKNIDAAGVTVNGSAAVLAGNQATWNATGLTPGGTTLNVAWTNTDGTAGAASVAVTVEAEDNTAPTVKDGTVKNGAKDVDPGPINESGKLEVTFSEAVVKGEASLGVDGGDALGTQAEWAADKLTLSLNAGVALANETTYVILIKGVKDAAGNAMAEAKISFTTKGKE